MNDYISKIDKKLLLNINILKNDEDFIECIVYLKDLDAFSKYSFDFFEIIYKYSFLNALSVKIRLNKLKDLAQLSQVIYISSQAQVYAQVNRAKEILNVNKFYSQNYFGNGITIAVIDTGLAPHLDFFVPNNNILLFRDFVQHQSCPYDDNGHGTVVSGIIAGSGIKSCKKYMGVAPHSKIISLKVLNAMGQTTTIEMLKAMQWIYDNHEKYNIDIVCMSFGSTPVSHADPLILGAEALWEDGIVVVSAGGNSGPEHETIKSPGGSSKIITVGSIDDGRATSSNSLNLKDVRLADFSSRGPAFSSVKPDLLTSGVDIISTSSDLSYTSMSGTSVSTPIVVGVCALLQQKYHKTLSPIQVKECLIENCYSLGLDRNAQGYGYLRF